MSYYLFDRLQRQVPYSAIVQPDGNQYIARIPEMGIEFSGTDATSVIQQAINALPNGGKVLIKRGIYNLSGPITLPSNIIFEGEGIGNTVLTGAVVSIGAMIQVKDQSNVVVRDLTADANGNFFATLALSRNTHDVVISGVELKNGYDRNLWMWDEGITGARVKRVIVTNCLIGKRMPVSGRPFISPVDPSVDINQVEDIILRDNIFVGDLNPPSGFTYPMVLLWASVEGGPGTNLNNFRTSIIGNHFIDHHTGFIRIVSTNEAKIIGNTFTNAAGSAIGFQDDHSYGFIVSDNQVYNCEGFLMMLPQDFEYSGIIKGNYVRLSRQTFNPSIHIAGRGKVKVYGNTFIQNNQNNSPWYAGGAVMAINSGRALFAEILHNTILDLNTNGVPLVIDCGGATPAAEVIFEGNVFNKTNPFVGANHPTLGNRFNSELFMIAKDYLAKYKMGRNYAFTDTLPEKVLLKSGYVNSGTATLAANSTSLTVNHGLVAAPNKVIITPQANVGAFWVSNITATSFTINVATAPAANVNFSWEAEV